ncbi:hypothetical protein Gasu2_33950 [Galdieria sulphuraria]|nr:hypothetical protein Gasu2_33950 [Galdieria sulphuraria]
MESKVALCMIVRDEESNIEQALNSTIKFIDAAVITDTGSKDRTKEIIRDYFQNQPHIALYLSETPFVDFSHARNFNYSQAKRHLPKNYHWFGFQMDADDEVIAAENFKAQEICIPGKKILIRSIRGNTAMNYFGVFDLELSFMFFLPVHEMPFFESNNIPSVHIPSNRIHVLSRHNGYRFKYGDKEQELRIMETFVESQPDGTLKQLAGFHRLATMNTDLSRLEDAKKYYGLFLKHPLRFAFETLYSFALCRYAHLLYMLDKKYLEALYYAFLCIYLCPSYLEPYYIVSTVALRLHMPGLAWMASTCALTALSLKRQKLTAENSNTPDLILKLLTSLNEAPSCPPTDFVDSWLIEQIKKES